MHVSNTRCICFWNFPFSIHNVLNYFIFRCKEAKLRQETTSRILVNIKAGVEHLSDKLQYLKAPKTQVPQTNLNPTTEEYILDLLGKLI